MTYGFVAQEMGQVFPLAVDKSTNTVPNIYSKCPVQGDRITLDVSKLEYDASGQVFPRLKLKDDKETFVQILKVETNTVQVDKTFTEDNIFVYGQEVNDFHTLENDMIWTVSAAALQEVDRQLQEVDRQLQQEKTKTKTLEEDVQTLKQENIQIQSKYEQLLARIMALESK